MTSVLQVSCVQLHWAKPLEFNLERTLYYTAEAARAGSRVVLFPEPALPGGALEADDPGGRGAEGLEARVSGTHAPSYHPQPRPGAHHRDGRMDVLSKPYTWKAPRIDIWLQVPVRR